MHTYKTNELYDMWVCSKITLEVTRGQFKVTRATGGQTLKATSTSMFFVCMLLWKTKLTNIIWTWPLRVLKVTGVQTEVTEGQI